MNLREGYRKLRIFHDEAHNTKEGIPAHMTVIENIIKYNVEKNLLFLMILLKKILFLVNENS